METHIPITLSLEAIAKQILSKVLVKWGHNKFLDYLWSLYIRTCSITKCIWATVWVTRTSLKSLYCKRLSHAYCSCNYLHTMKGKDPCAVAPLRPTTATAFPSATANLALYLYLTTPASGRLLSWTKAMTALCWYPRPSSGHLDPPSAQLMFIKQVTEDFATCFTLNSE